MTLTDDQLAGIIADRGQDPSVDALLLVSLARELRVRRRMEAETARMLARATAAVGSVRAAASYQTWEGRPEGFVEALAAAVREGPS